MKKHLLTALAVLLAVAVAPTWAGNRADERQVMQDLRAAFIDATVASAKYAAYAEKARNEGLDKIALLFEAGSKSKDITAANHKAGLMQLNEPVPTIQSDFKVNSTRENLRAAIDGEANGTDSMYPGFIEDAMEAKIAIADISFNYAYKSQVKHRAFYLHALNALENGGIESLPSMYRVCPTCGNIYPDEGPVRCGHCLTHRDRHTTVK